MYVYVATSGMGWMGTSDEKLKIGLGVHPWARLHAEPTA